MADAEGDNREEIFTRNRTVFELSSGVEEKEKPYTRSFIEAAGNTDRIYKN